MKKIQILFKSMLMAALLLAVACGGNQSVAIDYDKLTYPQLMEQAGAEQVQAWYDCDSRLDEDEVAARGAELKKQKKLLRKLKKLQPKKRLKKKLLLKMQNNQFRKRYLIGGF